MLDLIERLEKATGPDGALNAAIDCRVRFPDLRPAKPDDHLEHQNGIPPGANSIWCPTGFLRAEPYTSSVDAALKLVPEKWTWSVHSVFRSDGEMFSAFLSGGCRHSESIGRYAAIALCIASLKARAALNIHDRPMSHPNQTEPK